MQTREIWKTTDKNHSKEKLENVSTNASENKEVSK